jgi:hypothetical protein
MSRKYDEIFNKMKDELEGGTPEPKTEGTPESTEGPKPETTPEPNDGTGHESEPEPVKGGTEEPERGEGGEPEPGKEPQPKQIPDDPMKRAEYSFKRQLAKSKEKHEKELAERDAKYNELAKKFEELEKKVTPKEAKKTRDSFETDDDYIDYLVEQRMKALNADRDAELSKKEAERLENERKAKAEQEELQQRQNAWLENVDNAFAHDAERTKKFIAKVQYANRNGLGEILDQCPVASDYLINDPNGPKVFERMLDDPQVFRRVFNPQRTSPMAIYWELKQVEQEISTAPNGAPSPAQKPIPKMGKPGRQAGGSTLMGDMFDDPRQVKKWLKEHR